MGAGSPGGIETKFTLIHRTPEERLVELLKRWAPESGYGLVRLELTYHQGRIVEVTRVNGMEKVRLE